MDKTVAAHRKKNHVTDAVYTFFVSMEMEVRQHLDNASEECGIKEVAMSGIRENEEIQLFWSMIADDWEEKQADTLLEFIIEHYVTLRGFS